MKRFINIISSVILLILVLIIAVIFAPKLFSYRADGSCKRQHGALLHEGQSIVCKGRYGWYKDR